jgi:hypothetical protein
MNFYQMTNSVAWAAALALSAIILSGSINEAAEALHCSALSSTRTEVIGQETVLFWSTTHRGEPVRIYICPGEDPRIAIAHQRLTCGESI